MKFAEAFSAMKSGAKVKLPSWAGYWDWDPEKETILMHSFTRGGKWSMIKPKSERGGIVTKDWENSYHIMWSDGSSGWWDKDRVVKTGRHFDIDKILEEMRT